ncbi:hypothetical protein [Streptomyces sp. WZ-12]|uniref:hypothetical protein n=1 Tax=Streptomyces sp. WZ-12 TaxID=3030210 RepID=UPI0023815386|nr:hypothetical protein [Streptomyces sp. WZ-12]
MKTFIGSHQVVTTVDALELALGTPLDLWLGADGESREERAARLDAARDILGADPDLYDRAVRTAATVLGDDRVRRLGALHHSGRGPFRHHNTAAPASLLSARHGAADGAFEMGDAA